MVCSANDRVYNDVQVYVSSYEICKYQNESGDKNGGPTKRQQFFSFEPYFRRLVK